MTQSQPPTDCDERVADGGTGPKRRDLLRRGGATLAVVTVPVLSGCAGGGPETDAQPTPSATTTAMQTTPTSTASPTPANTPVPTPNGPNALDSRIREDGHYSWFALNEDNWGRQSSPYDMQQGASRWFAQPTTNDAIRLLVKAIDHYPYSYQSTGFDIHLGRLGDIDRIEVRSEAIQSGQFDPQLVLALYLDEDENGEFFAWTDSNHHEAWVNLDGDEEAILPTAPTVGEPAVIDDDTGLQMLNRDAASASLGDLKHGDIEHHSEDKGRAHGENRGIDAETYAGLYVGLADNGNGSPVEATIQEVTIE